MKPMKNHGNHARVVAGLITFSGLVLGGLMTHEHGAQTAMAADDKIFAPQSCVPEDPDVGGIGRAEIHFYDIEQNTVEGYQTFICPLVRDEVTGTLDDVWVRVFNDSPVEDTPPRCCVNSISIGASMSDFECRTAPDVEGQLSLHFTLSDFTEFDYGHYTVDCDLGDGDTIIGIRTSESP